MSELKPCPFCWKPAEMESRKYSRFAVICSNELCGCAFTDWHDSEVEAVAQWNTRAPQSEWISVDDKLPEKLVNVLVKQIYQDEIMLAYISACGKLWIECCENACVNGDAWLSKEICKVTDSEDYLKITHWMLLPPLPKDSKQ